MKKIIIANWKMNPQSMEEAQALFKAVLDEVRSLPNNFELVVCPPVIFLEELSKRPASPEKPLPELIKFGAQDIFWEPTGAYTGEISSAMLKSFKISHVLIGHSDRRYTMGESDEVINKKIKAALLAGITPILLVGEKELVDAREEILIDQLARDLEGLATEHIKNIFFCYEPVWAISSQPDAKPDTPENAVETIKFIENILAKNWKIKSEDLVMLYGGSVTEQNVTGFLSRPEIDGAIIGGASIRAEEFGRILKLVALLP